MRAKGEHGFGLIEVLVASSLLVIALGIFGAVLVVVSRSTDVSQELGAASDDLGTAITNLDAQVRSAYWVKSATMPCAGPDGAVVTCTVLKVLTTYKASPYAAVCWTWRLAPLPGPPGGNVDPDNRFGRLQSAKYAPGYLGPITWVTEVGSVDFPGSSLLATGSFKALNPTTRAYVTGFYSGISLMISIAQDSDTRLVGRLSSTIRNRRNAANGVFGGLTCPVP